MRTPSRRRPTPFVLAFSLGNPNLNSDNSWGRWPIFPYRSIALPPAVPVPPLLVHYPYPIPVPRRRARTFSPPPSAHLLYFNFKSDTFQPRARGGGGALARSWESQAEAPGRRAPRTHARETQRVSGNSQHLCSGDSAGFVFAVLIQTPPHCLFQRCANYYLDSRAQSPCPFPSTK